MTNRRGWIVGGILGAAGSLWGYVAMGQASDEAAPALVFAFELRAQVGEPMEIGQVPHGRRRIVEILGGTVVRIGERIHNGSVRRRMTKLRRQLISG